MKFANVWVNRMGPINVAMPSMLPFAFCSRPCSDGLTSRVIQPCSAGFINDGDNELTGIHVSDGDPDVNGILGAKVPRPFKDGWRVFYTQQHGDNVTYEIVHQNRDRSRGGLEDDDDRW